MITNYVFTLLVLSCVSLNGMHSASSEEARKAKIALHYIPVNNTNSDIKFTGMTGIQPRLGEAKPWCYEKFAAKSEKKEFHFLFTETMNIETDKAIFEVKCPQEMTATLLAYGTLKNTQEALEAKKFRFLLSGASKVRLIVNDTSIDFEDITDGCKPFQFAARTTLPIA